MRLAMGFPLEVGQHERFCEIAREAEAAGFAMVGVGDSPAWLGDVYIGMTLLAQSTNDCKLTTWVTNPVTRHPLVIASAISTVDAISGGRAILAIGSGETGVYNLGVPRATLRDIATFVETIRQVWDTGAFPTEHGASKVPWAQRRVPIYLAPGGPKGLQLAGAIADGVIIETGVVPEVVKLSLDEVRAGAAQAGRDFADLDIWWHVRACLSDTTEEARQFLRSQVAGMGNRAVNYGLNSLIPDSMADKFLELNRRYDKAGHGPMFGNAPLVDELGLTDYLLDRWGLGGTPQDWIARLTEFEDRGVNQVAMSVVVPDKLAFVQRLGREVISTLPS